MFNLLKAVSVLAADYKASQKAISSASAERKSREHASAPKYTARTISLAIENSTDPWIVSIHKGSLGTAEIKVVHKELGVQATRGVRVPRQFVSVAAALNNDYFETQLNELKDEALSFTKQLVITKV